MAVEVHGAEILYQTPLQVLGVEIVYAPPPQLVAVEILLITEPYNASGPPWQSDCP